MEKIEDVVKCKEIIRQLERIKSDHRNELSIDEARLIEEAQELLKKASDPDDNFCLSDISKSDTADYLKKAIQLIYYFFSDDLQL